MKATTIFIGFSVLALFSVAIKADPTCADVDCGGSPCCDGTNVGAICYSNTTHQCIFNGAGSFSKSVCAIGESACNTSCYSPTEYVCQYSTLVSSETTVTVIQLLCPTNTPSACGYDCYDPAVYSCCQSGADFAPALTFPARSVCQLRETIFSCYNNASSICCENDLSHGLGSICAQGSSCCGYFGNIICTDPSSQQCCPASIAPTNCALNEACCGYEYPTCIDPTTEICCCANEESQNTSSHFSCPADNTCDCTNARCVAP